MKIKSLFTFLCISLVIGFGCKKDEDPIPPVEDPVTSTQVLTDFAGFVANPTYLDLQIKVTTLQSAVLTLSTSTTDPNLAIAKDAWIAVRTPWEQSEAFLFGPAEDFNYDPKTDTWPVNTTELDSLLSSSNPLELVNIDSLEYSLKGYHAIEYMLFGVGGTRTASQFTLRELQYLNSLTESLLNTVTELKNSWDPTQPGNFTNELITAGNGSTRFLTRKDALLTIVAAMGGICNEVANGKMEEPLLALDSELVESQYAHITSIDFKNNMIGVQNVYLCKFTSTGKSLHDFVAAKDATLDLAIRSQINTAISAIEDLDPNYGMAIFTQVGQIQVAQSSINDLESILNQLTNFIHTHVND